MGSYHMSLCLSQDTAAFVSETKTPWDAEMVELNDLSAALSTSVNSVRPATKMYPSLNQHDLSDRMVACGLAAI